MASHSPPASTVRSRSRRPGCGAAGRRSARQAVEVDADAGRVPAGARRRAAGWSERRRARRPAGPCSRARAMRAAAASPPSSGRCRPIVSRPPRMTVSRLLKSCATPPVSWPTASIFCDWRSRSSALRRASCCASSSRVRSLHGLLKGLGEGPELRRLPLAPGDIDADAEHAHGAAGVVVEDQPAQFDPAQLLVDRAHDAELDFHARRAPGEGLGHLLGDPRPVFLPDACEPARQAAVELAEPEQGEIVRRQVHRALFDVALEDAEPARLLGERQQLVGAPCRAYWRPVSQAAAFGRRPSPSACPARWRAAGG